MPRFRPTPSAPAPRDAEAIGVTSAFPSSNPVGRLRRAGFLLCGLLVAAAAGLSPQPAAAQLFDGLFPPRPPAGVPAPSRSAPNWRPPAQPQQPTFFGIPLGPPPQAVQPPPVRQAAPTPPPDPQGTVYVSAAEAMQGRRQPPSRFVLVIGDWYGRQVAEGLADLYVGERTSPAVVAITADPSGFQTAPVDWVNRLPGAIDAGKPDAIVLALGVEDLEPIREGETDVQPLTDRWAELYGKRVDDVLAAARGPQGRRVILLGLPPVQSAPESQEYERLNDLLRTHAARSGAVYVNVWDGFVDEDGKYTASGPAVDGQRRRLRQADGERFTRAGGRKLAFFVQKELTRLLAEPGPAANAPAADGSQPISLNDGPRGGASLAGGPPPVGRGAANILPASAPGSEALKALSDGSPIAARTGRTDDFSWPPKTQPGSGDAQDAR